MALVRVAAGALLLAVGLAAPGAARAQDDGESDYSREGVYAGLGGFFALEDAQEGESGDNGGGVSGLLGIRVDPVMALELEGTWVSELVNDDLGGVGVNLKLYLAELAGADLAGGRVQPYAIGSAGAVWAGSEAGARYLGGLGAETYLSENVALDANIGYVGHGGEPSTTRYVRFFLGALYRW